MNKYLIVLAIAALSFYLIKVIIPKFKQRPLNIKKIKKFDSLYIFFTKIPVIGNEIITLKKSLYDNNLLDESINRYKVVSYYLMSWGVGILAFIISNAYFGSYFKKSIYVTLVLIVFSYFFKDAAQEILIGDDTNILIGIKEFIKGINSNYDSSYDIDVVIEEMIDKTNNYLLAIYGKIIQDSIQDEETIENFNTNCENSYLRLVVMNCYQVKEFGDSLNKNEESTLKQNLQFIYENIDTELFKRRSLKMWLKGLSLLALAPILGFTIIEKFIYEHFKQAIDVYSTGEMLKTKILLMLFIIGCFLFIKSYESSKYKRKIFIKDKYWEETLLKIPILKKIIEFITPKIKSKRYYNYKKLISESGSYLKVEWLFLHRFIFAVSFFILSALFLNSMHKLDYQNIIENKYIVSIDYAIIKGQQVDTTAIENDVITKLDKNDVNKNKIVIMLKEKGIYNEKDLNNLSNKIDKKITSINNEHFNLKDLMRAIIIAAAVSFLPILKLKLRIKHINFQMEEETLVFEDIILIHSNSENGTIGLMLENMQTFANVFYDIIEKVINVINDNESFDELIDEIPYEPLSKLMRSLKDAEDKEISEAFKYLISERKNYNETRKDDDKKLVENRKHTASLVSMLPYLGVLYFYLMIPLMDTVGNQMDNISKALG